MVDDCYPIFNLPKLPIARNTSYFTQRLEREFTNIKYTKFKDKNTLLATTANISETFFRSNILVILIFISESNTYFLWPCFCTIYHFCNLDLCCTCNNNVICIKNIKSISQGDLIVATYKRNMVLVTEYVVHTR